MLGQDGKTVMASVQETAEQAIRDGLDDKGVLRRVLGAHPGANVSTEAVRWYRERLRQEAPASDADIEVGTAHGRAIRDLLREGLPDYVVFRRVGAISLATVRAHRASLMRQGAGVPSADEARMYWAALSGAATVASAKP